MTNAEKLLKALEEFKTKYPTITSGDLQTFIIGWQESEKTLGLSIDEQWNEYRTITNNEDAWCFKEWLKNHSLNNLPF